jgi:protein-disulfide isomerase
MKILSTCVAVAVSISPLYGAFTPEQKKELGIFIESYFQENPEILEKTITQLTIKKKAEQDKKLKELILKNKDKIYEDGHHIPFLGNEKSDKKLVVFLDPYCGYCRKFEEVLKIVSLKRKDIKILFRDLPIFGESSVTAVQALLGAHTMGDYWKFKDEMMKVEPGTPEDDLEKMARKVKLDWKKIKSLMSSEKISKMIESNQKLSESLEISGTPTIVFGEKIFSGLMSEEDLINILDHKEGSSEQNPQSLDQEKPVHEDTPQDPVDEKLDEKPQGESQQSLGAEKTSQPIEDQSKKAEENPMGSPKDPLKESLEGKNTVGIRSPELPSKNLVEEYKNSRGAVKNKGVTAQSSQDKGAIENKK